MKKIFITFYLLLSILISNQLLVANPENSNARYGIFGGMNFNFHTADFYKLRNIPNCCPNFETGIGMGFSGGVLYEYKIMNNVWLGARLGLMNLYGELSKEEETTIIIDSGPESGVFEHQLIGKFPNLGIEPLIIYNPINRLNLSAGLRLGMNLSNTFEQVERITKPSGYGTFIDSDGNNTFSRTRNKFSGDIPDAVQFQMFVTGGISYDLPINRDGSLMLAPEIQFYLPITELVENTDWKVNIARAGIALKYTPQKTQPIEEIFREEIRIDTIRIEKDFIAGDYVAIGQSTQIIKKEVVGNIHYTITESSRTDTMFLQRRYLLSADIQAVGVDANDMEIPNPIFKVEEFVFNRLDPLLNYVFFDDNSSSLPERYVVLDAKSAANFTVDSLYTAGTLEIYYNMLNIIGERLNKYPNAKITLIGCNSDIDSEKGNTELSRKRAEQVKNYFMSTFKINSNRISIVERNLPAKPSTPTTEPDKIAENRRVEIISEDYRIVEPIFIKNIRRTANPPILRFKPTISSELDIKNWKISAYQNEASEKIVISGENAPPTKIDRTLEEDQSTIPQFEDMLYYYFEIADEKGNTDKSETKEIEIKVLTISEKRVNRIDDYEIEKFSLILFDFDDANISGNNKRIIDYIKTRLQNHSEIEIIGYTDRTGDDVYNLRLSERRASNTKSSIGRNDAVSLGKGKQVLLYDNDLPEGRFYCRTVEIIVKNKIEVK